MTIIEKNPLFDEVLIPRSAARKSMHASQTTWWRWTQDPQMQVPTPVKIKGRWFYRKDEFEVWREKTIAKALGLKFDKRATTKNGRPLGRPRKEVAHA